MSPLFWCFESSTEIVEFLCRDSDFSHIEANSELWCSDETRSESVKVSEELSNSNSLLTACLSDASKHILNICWGVTDDFSFADASLCLWEIVKAMIKVSSNAKQHLLVVDILCKVYVVDLVNISFVHVTSQQHLKFSLWCCDAQ